MKSQIYFGSFLALLLCLGSRFTVQAQFDKIMQKAGRVAEGVGEKMKENKPDDGVKTEFHRNNLGKIVFSSKKIANDGSNIVPPSLTTDIYAKVFMPQSLKKWYTKQGMKDYDRAFLYLVFSIPGRTGKYVVKDVFVGGEEFEKSTALEFLLLPNSDPDNPNNRFSDARQRPLAYAISLLPAGKQKIKVSLQLSKDAKEEDVFGEGELELDITAPERDAVAKKFGEKFKGNINTYPDKELVAVIKQQYPKDIAQELCCEEIIRNVYGQVIRRKFTLDRVIINQFEDYYMMRTEITQEFIGNKWDDKVAGRIVDFGYHVPLVNVEP